MRNIWKCDGNIQHLRKSGGIGAYLFQSCVLLLVNVSSISLGKGFAPLRCTCTLKLLRGCGWAMAAARSWGGRISLTVCFFVCFLFGAVAKLWETSHKQFGFTLFSQARLKVESISQALCSCTLWKLERKKHFRITQCVFHMSASQPRSVWNVQSQHSS